MAPKRDPNRRAKLVRAAPYVLGGAAIVVGLALGLRSIGGGSGETAVDAGSHEGGAGGGAYVPDLSGPVQGKPIVPGIELASGLGVVADRLVWLTTDDAALYSVPLERGKAAGEPSPLYKAGDKAFGGSLAASREAVCWAELGREPTSVLCLSRARLVSRGEPERVEEGGSPDHLTLSGDRLYWSNHGQLYSWAPGEAPQRLAAPGQRVAGLALARGAVVWLDVPYSDGARGAYRLSSWKESGTKVLAQLGERRERRWLWADGDTIGWAEQIGEDDGWALRVLEGKESRTLVATGEVTAVEVGDGHVVWAEAHETEGGVATVLRKMPSRGGKVERIGLADGPVSGLALEGKVIYWSDRRGIVSHPLE
jgi:hypothetical protein